MYNINMNHLIFFVRFFGRFFGWFGGISWRNCNKSPNVQPVGLCFLVGVGGLRGGSGWGHAQHIHPPCPIFGQLFWPLFWLVWWGIVVELQQITKPAAICSPLFGGWWRILWRKWVGTCTIYTPTLPHFLSTFSAAFWLVWWDIVAELQQITQPAAICTPLFGGWWRILRLKRVGTCAKYSPTLPYFLSAFSAAFLCSFRQIL
jgi:hypothetical protein